MTTFGRGLDLVAMMSSRWGSDLAHDGRSKSVWFEPTVEAKVDPHREGEIFDFDPEFIDGPEIPDAERLPITLLARARRACSASSAATTSSSAGSCGCWR